jgi:hypothetical protein
VLTEQVVIENTSKSKITKISITDVLGREVLISNPNQLGNIKLNTESFNKGVYLVRVWSDSDSFSVKLLKE